MTIQPTRKTLTTLRRRYAGLPPTSPKALGLRRIRDALRYVDRADMTQHVAQLTADATFHLPYAEASR